MRGECNPRGPAGFMLGSIHLQPATMDEAYKMQWNQQSIDLVNGPAQQVVPLASRMAAINRTRRAEGARFEAEGLGEIDNYATNAKHPNEVKDETGQMILRTPQRKSNWTKELTKTTGKTEDNKCALCGEKKPRTTYGGASG